MPLEVWILRELLWVVNWILLLLLANIALHVLRLTLSSNLQNLLLAVTSLLSGQDGLNFEILRDLFQRLSLFFSMFAPASQIIVAIRLHLKSFILSYAPLVVLSLDQVLDDIVIAVASGEGWRFLVSLKAFLTHIWPFVRWLPFGSSWALVFHQALYELGFLFFG